MDYDRLRELQEKFEENPRRYFAPLANEYRKGGQPKRAIEICRAQLAQMPGHMSGQIVFGQALYEAGEFDEAREVFQRALALDPENLIALRSLGDMALQSGNTVEARSWYMRLLDADPKDTPVVALVSEIDAAAEAVPIPAPDEVPVDRDEGDQAIPFITDAEGRPTEPQIEPAPQSVAATESNPAPAAAESAPAPRSEAASPPAQTETARPEAVAQPPAPGEASAPPLGLERHYPVESPSVREEPALPSPSDPTSEDYEIPLGAEGLRSAMSATPRGAESLRSLLPPEPPKGAEGLRGAARPAAPVGTEGLKGKPVPSALERSTTPEPEPEPLPAPELVPATESARAPEPARTPEPPRAPPPARAPEPIAASGAETGAPRTEEPSVARNEDEAALEAWTPPPGANVHERTERRKEDRMFSGGSPEPFVNETMAQLYLQQGYRQLALKVYYQLAEARPNDQALKDRIAEIEAADRAAHPDAAAAAAANAAAAAAAAGARQAAPPAAPQRQQAAPPAPPQFAPQSRREPPSIERPSAPPAAPRSPSIESPTSPGAPDSEETPSFDRTPIDSPSAPSRQRESVEAPSREEPRAEPEGIAAREPSIREFFATLGRRKPPRSAGSASGRPPQQPQSQPTAAASPAPAPPPLTTSAPAASLDAVFAGATVNPSDSRAAARLAGAFSGAPGSVSKTPPTPPMPTPRVNQRLPQAQESEEDVAKFRAWLDGLTGE